MFLCHYVEAQNFPHTFSYQAVARNKDGTAIANKQIVVEISILQGNDCTSGCNLVWQELHYPKTNAFGLFSIKIGAGQTTFAGSASSFDAIDWNNLSSGNYYLKIRVDFGSSDNISGLIDIGTVMLQSVPYSNSAEYAENLTKISGKVSVNLTDLKDVQINNLSANQVLEWDGSSWKNVNLSSTGASSLNELSDVTLNSPNKFDFLMYNGTNWVNNKAELNNLSDVDTSGITNGQVLMWNGSVWKNQSLTKIWNDDGKYVYYDGGENLGIGTSTPRGAIEAVAVGDSGFIFRGSFSTGAIDNLGAGSRMTFYPSKAAFRAGYVDADQWDNSNAGNYSVAFGKNNIANGTYTAAFGSGNTASSSACFVTGKSNKIVDEYGYYGTNSLAMGTGNTVRAMNSIVFGQACEIGKSDIADNGIVGGYDCNASAKYVFALGEGLEANYLSEIVIGKYNVAGTGSNSWNATDPIFVIGNGTDASNRQNSLVIYKNGDIKTAGTLTQNVTNPTKSYIKISSDNILKLNIFSYKNSGRTKYAFLPKDVEKYFPELIYNYDGQKSIATIEFIPLLLQQIKTQQNTIDVLQSENIKLNKKLDALEQRVSKLENRK